MSRDIDSAELVGIPEIASELDVERSAVYYWIKQPSFPEPVADLRCGRIWIISDIRAWRSEFAKNIAGALREKPGPRSN